MMQTRGISYSWSSKKRKQGNGHVCDSSSSDMNIDENGQLINEECAEALNHKKLKTTETESVVKLTKVVPDASNFSENGSSPNIDTPGLHKRHTNFLYLRERHTAFISNYLFIFPRICLILFRTQFKNNWQSQLCVSWNFRSLTSFFSHLGKVKIEEKTGGFFSPLCSSIFLIKDCRWVLLYSYFSNQHEERRT